MTTGMSQRDEVIRSLLVRREKSLPTRRIFAYDEDGRTYEVAHATRESKRWKKGSLKMPPTAKAVCLEGDQSWQPLPGFLTIRDYKAQETLKRKRSKSLSDAKRASGAPSAASR